MLLDLRVDQPFVLHCGELRFVTASRQMVQRDLGERTVEFAFGELVLLVCVDYEDILH